MTHPVRINLGSGQRPFGRGWTNVDSQARWAPDVTADGGEYLAGLADGSVGMIALHHVLEHYGAGEAAGMIQECWRALAPGGSLLIFVPDLDALARMWLEGRLSTQVYVTNLYGAYMGDEADRHKWGFDRVSLRIFLLECARWSRVLDFDWRAIDGADIAGPDRWILGMEAVR